MKLYNFLDINFLYIILFFSLLVYPFHKLDGQICHQFSLPLWFSDYMMVPSDVNWQIQGNCDSFQEVSVCFNETKISTKADAEGRWKIDFQPIKSGISGEMVLICKGEKIIIKEVISGNIWLCAGQSNMSVPVSFSAESAEVGNDICSLDIRYFDGNKWSKVTNENVQNISAVALFFAVEMAKSQKSPIGVFVAARGGTGVETWVPEDAFPDNETAQRFKRLMNDPLVLKAAQEDKEDLKPFGQHRLAKWELTRAVPTSLFNELILPYKQMPLTGVIWYQGESNTEKIDQATEYHIWLENLILSYRKLFNNSILPFAIIQIPDYEPELTESREAWRIIQSAQEKVASKTQQTALVDIKDLGDLNDLHPRKKKEVGVRTAKAICKLINN